MGHSKNCSDLRTRWDNNLKTCVQCDPVEKGYEIPPNCGYDDDGGRHEPAKRRCKNGTFNDGTNATCQPCSSCSSGHTVIYPCNTTTDTQCAVTSAQPATVDATQTSTTGSNLPGTGPNPLWAVPIIFMGAILVLSVCIIYRKKRGHMATLSYRKRSSLINDGFSPLSVAINDDLEEVLSYDIMSRPLQTVLNNLDVLEELVILLDPDINTVKSTKHLASLCSFSSTWITYAYSMKDTKSPLKAVLEGITSKYPDWTVGDLAKILKKMERNDAIAVLTQLKPQVVTI